ncbi:MAG: YhcH/YjgK/YiaL family protein [Stygiobacter sp.]
MMIVDKIENLGNYLPEKVMDFYINVKGKDFNTKEFNSENIYLKNIEYYTDIEYNARIESHKNYVDIQFILNGEELIMIYDTNKLSTNTFYDTVEDVIFYENTDDFLSMINLQMGYFCIFSPNDAHKAAISFNSKSKVNKVVIKVNRDLFEKIL